MAATNYSQRTIEDFLINPTMPFRNSLQDVPSRYPKSDRVTVSRRSADMKQFPAEIGTALLQSLTFSSSMYRKYGSEEEIASPMGGLEDVDGAGCCSMDDSTSTFSDVASLTDSLAQFEEEAECINVQTATFVPTARAKVVSLAPVSPTLSVRSSRPSGDASLKRSTIDFSFRNYLQETSHSDLYRERNQQLGSRQHRSRSMSLYIEPVARNGFTTPTTAQTNAVGQQARRPSLPTSLWIARAHTDLASSTSAMTQSEHTRSQPLQTLGRYDAGSTPRPATSSSSRTSMIFNKASRPLFRKLGQKLVPTRSEEDAVASPASANLDSSPAPPRSRPKMVARGANERAPIITLPPCPDDYEPVAFSSDVSVNASGTIVRRNTSDDRKRRSVALMLSSLRG